MPELGEFRKGTDVGKHDPHNNIYVECPACHKKRWSRYKGYQRNKYPYLICELCIRRPGSDHPVWKGGKHFIRGYYRMFLSPDDPYFQMADKNRYVFEHRYVMAQYLGRCLKQWEIVHHRNGIKSDNRIENLELVTHLENVSASVFSTKSMLKTINKQDERIRQLEARVTLLEAENIALRKYDIDPFLFKRRLSI